MIRIMTDRHHKNGQTCEILSRDNIYSWFYVIQPKFEKTIFGWDWYLSKGRLKRYAILRNRNCYRTIIG